MAELDRAYLGFDFGASSGRAILGRLSQDKKLDIEEIYRFPNEALPNGKYLAWEIERLFNEVKTGIGIAAKKGVHIEAIGVDTWGVDFGIIEKKTGKLVFAPVSYRDSRTDGMMEEAYKIMPKEEIFRCTGLAFMQFNTLYQILAMQKDPETAKFISEDYTLLFMPDLFEYYLTGNVGTEYTIASTSQLINPAKRTWSKEILSAFHIPEGFLAPLQDSGTVRGYLKKEICPEIDYEVPVIAVASHDTASAVAAVPGKKGENFAYISSGTWSIFGIETTVPQTAASVMEVNFSNEGGLNGTTRLLKNIMGLWIIQECRKQFNMERKEQGLEPLSFADIVTEVNNTPDKPDYVIDVDDQLFFAPDHMVDKIVSYVEARGGHIDENHKVGIVADIVYRSLALKYRWAVESIEHITGKRIDALYIVGGGGKNELLNIYTAQALMRPVTIGASEGTVIGNLLVQAMGKGDVKDLWEVREIVTASVGGKTYGYDEALSAKWDADYARLMELVK